MQDATLSTPKEALRPALAAVSALLVAAAILAYGPVVGALAFVAIFNVMVLVAAIARPLYLLALTLLVSSTVGALRNLGTVEIAGSDVSLSGAMTALLLAGTALSLLANLRTIRWPWILDLLPFVGLALLSGIRAVTSHLVAEGMKDTILLGGGLLFALLARQLVNASAGARRQIESLLLASVAVPLLVLMLGVPADAFEFTDAGFRGLIGQRPLALYLLVIMSLGLAVWRFPRNASARRVGGIVSLVCVGVILISLSRMATVIALGTLLPLRFLYAARHKGIRLALLGIMGVSLLCVVLQWRPMRQRFFGDAEVSLLRLEEAVQHMPANGRDTLSALTWSSAITRPLSGHGPGSAKRLVGSWYPGLGHPHNEYLRVFHDLGVPGLALLLWAWLGRIVRHFRRWSDCEKAGKGTDAAAQMAPALASVAVVLSISTDNTLMYIFVLIPVFVLMGIADETWVRSENSPASGDAAG